MKDNLLIHCTIRYLEMSEQLLLPLLSIIIPVFNRQRRLNELCLSLAGSIKEAKAAALIEVMVIDDHSDNLVTLKCLANSTVLLRNEKNLGAPKSREKGFIQSHGEFIHFHDSDDTFHKNWVASLIKVLQQNPSIDLLVTARENITNKEKQYNYQKFVNESTQNIKGIEASLLYQNCIGPLGGVTFSRKVLEHTCFKNFPSCQDWQMYRETIKHTKSIKSYPTITFNYSLSGDDRISKSPKKIILGHLLISRGTAKESIFGKNIRLYYLHACKQHVINTEGSILSFYKKHYLKIKFYYYLINFHHIVVVKQLAPIIRKLQSHLKNN